MQQYQQWGVGEFATRYTRDYNAVEAPAYEIQTQVAKALRASVASPELPRNRELKGPLPKAGSAMRAMENDS